MTYAEVREIIREIKRLDRYIDRDDSQFIASIVQRMDNAVHINDAYIGRRFRAIENKYGLRKAVV